MAVTPLVRTNPSLGTSSYDCERFLYYRSVDPRRPKRERIPEPEFDHSPRVASILASGCRWGAEVIEQRLKGRVVVAVEWRAAHSPRIACSDRALSPDRKGRPVPLPADPVPPHLEYFLRHHLTRILAHGLDGQLGRRSRGAGFSFHLS
jgi:hypothetical protein